MTTVSVIGVSGKLGTGKDYHIDTVIKPYLKEKGLTVKTMSFADHLKVSVAAENGLDINDMYGDKPPEIRRLLQKKGTEEGRDKYGPDIWINAMKAWIKLVEIRGEADVILIGDCRFKNEAKWITQNGLLVRLNAPDRNMERLKREAGDNNELLQAIATHPSETDLDGYQFKYSIDNSKSNDSNSAQQLLSILDENFRSQSQG